MTEFELIKACFADWPFQHPQVLAGIGDDCLVWLNPEPLVVSTDTAVSGVHFPEFATPEQIAQRAFLPAISDLAAMAAKPAFFTLALTLPTRCNGDWLTRFAKRLSQLSQQYEIMLAGGDTTKGEQLTITVSVHGTCAHPVMRSGARAGDDVYITGFLGQAAAALPYVLNQKEQEAPNDWTEAYWQPAPQIKFAQQLLGCIHSAIDLSDGLLGDAEHIAQQSRVRLNLRLDLVPIDESLQQLGEQGLQLAITGGDDYQLCFTADPQAKNEIINAANLTQTKITQIGHVAEGKAGVDWYDGDQRIELDWQSFRHF